ncbi:MAG: hypothetical protein J6A94_07335 [Lachnospiraceae bacterium]|nr:hypothetical protein [Lachnospiraceae bacterium]
MKSMGMSRQRGNVGNLMITGICMLAMTVVMLAYFDNVELLHQKDEMGQLARKYILKMETTGYLTVEDMLLLTDELEAMGVTEIQYGGTTVNAVPYGEAITLQIQGKLRGEYDCSEKRVSTAKH